MAGRHRARRRIGPAAWIAGLLVLLAAGAGAFFLLRDGGEEEAPEASACQEFRTEMVASYGAARGVEQELIDLYGELNVGRRRPGPKNLRLLEDTQAEAQAAYDDLNALRNPPSQLATDYTSIRASVNEFVALSRRVVEALSTGSELPTSSPHEQLQLLYDAQVEPAEVTAC